MEYGIMIWVACELVFAAFVMFWLGALDIAVGGAKNEIEHHGRRLYNAGDRLDTLEDCNKKTVRRMVRISKRLGKLNSRFVRKYASDTDV